VADPLQVKSLICVTDAINPAVPLINLIILI
jgi:hypothetical protein